MNELTTHKQGRPAAENEDMGFSPMMNPARFEHMYRVGRMLASSALWPAHLKGKNIEEGSANGMLCLNMAERLKEDPLTVAQNIYFVSGRPGWNTTYMIAKANMHGVFKNPIDWDVEGTGDKLSVTAYGILASTGKRVEVTCDMAMAKAEGWTKNPKYQSIPQQMLRYRSAAFLIRLYAPEVMIGVPAAVEIELDQDNFKDVTPKSPRDLKDVAALSGDDAEEIVGEKVDRTPPPPAETEKSKAAAKAREEEAAKKAKDDAAREAEAKAKAEAEAKKEAEREAEAKAKSEDEYDPETGEVTDEAPNAEPAKISGEEHDRLAAVAKAMMKDIESGDVTPEAVLKFYEEDLERIKVGLPETYAEIKEAAEG